MSEVRTKAERRADCEAVAAYHEAELGKLLEHVRQGFARWDAGAIDAFELDELIHHYKRAARRLWNACPSGGVHASGMARLLEQQAEAGEETDWWALAAPRRR